MEVLQDSIDDWKHLPEGWRLVHEAIVASRNVVDTQSVVAAMAAQGQAQGSGGGAGVSNTLDRIAAARENQRLRTQTQQEIQRGWNDNSAARAFRTSIWGN